MDPAVPISLRVLDFVARVTFLLASEQKRLPRSPPFEYGCVTVVGVPVTGVYVAVTVPLIRRKSSWPRSGRTSDGSGASRTRTGDLLGAIQALSQLSYSPERVTV
jgi:hypothetical protein